jgi:hypothetical protein
LRSNFGFVEFVAAIGKLFFAVTGLPDCHRVTPNLSSGLSYFSLQSRDTALFSRKPIGL